MVREVVSDKPKLLDGDVFSGEVGVVYRLALPFEGTWRRMLWFQVKEDASIYLGLCLKHLRWMRRGSKPFRNGQVTIGYDEGEPVTEASLIKNPKASFHGSGVIHAAGEFSSTEPLRSIREQREVCRVLLQHPSTFPTIRVPRRHDICIGYEFDESRPLQGIALAAPPDRARVILVRGARRQTTEWFEFNDLEAVPGLVVQIVLGDGPEAPWPPGSLIFFQTEAPR